MSVPAHRESSLLALRERLLEARRVVLTTHVNADGDGAGCEAAFAAWLRGRGCHVAIVNPTPFPEPFRFLLPENVRVADFGTPGADAELASAEFLLVLDTSEPARIGGMAGCVPRDRTLVLDHHPPGPTSVSDIGLMDPTAAATGELAYDFFQLDEAGVPPDARLGIYVAIVTDTGSFRYSNTTPRTHQIAADLLAGGVDPEDIYQRLFATVPRRRVELLREALATLAQDQEFGLSWMVVPQSLIEQLHASPEDLDGLVEYARSLAGTEVALLFRGTPDAQTKISLRSNGAADVNRIARQLGGGGHVKASGATVVGPPDEVVPRVLALARVMLQSDIPRYRGSEE